MKIQIQLDPDVLALMKKRLPEEKKNYWKKKGDRLMWRAAKAAVKLNRGLYPEKQIISALSICRITRPRLRMIRSRGPHTTHTQQRRSVTRTNSRSTDSPDGGSSDDPPARPFSRFSLRKIGSHLDSVSIASAPVCAGEVDHV